MGSTLPRAPAVRAVSEGRGGQLDYSSRCCLGVKTQRHTESTRLSGPLGGVCSHTPEAHSVGAKPGPDRRRFPSSLLPSPDRSGGLSLTLRVWAPAHSPSSGEAAPEPRLQEGQGARAW